MTHNDDQDSAFGAELDATVANLVDELRMLPYEQLLRHAALTTLAAREYSALLEQKGALLRSAIEDAADSGERLGMAASVMKDLAAASTNEVSRLRGKVVEVAIKAHASGTKRTARAGGIAKNAENAAMKAEVFRWLDRHLSEYQGRLDAAADAIEAAKLVPLTWRTIRNYITDYNKLQKQLQSAGTQ